MEPYTENGREPGLVYMLSVTNKKRENPCTTSSSETESPEEPEVGPPNQSNRGTVMVINSEPASTSHSHPYGTRLNAPRLARSQTTPEVTRSVPALPDAPRKKPPKAQKKAQKKARKTAHRAIRRALRLMEETGLDESEPETVDLEEEGTSSSQYTCLLYTSPSPRDKRQSRMPSSA